MYEQENDLQNNRFLVAQESTASTETEKTACRKSFNKKKKVDNKCFYELPTDYVRIEYPGCVKNVYKAIESLGGMHGIEMALFDGRNKLDLHFHQQNIYNKPCTGDRDTAPGVLVRVKKTGDKLDYDIFGVTSVNYTFNKPCDFQYLPLVPSDTNIDEDIFIHHKIIPEKIADEEYTSSEEAKTIPIFNLPANFSRFDGQSSLYLNAIDKFSEEIPNRPEMFKMWAGKRSKKMHPKIFTRMVNLQNPDVEIPNEPLMSAVQMIEERGLEREVELVKKLFNERPMWTNVAVQYKTGLKADMTKNILPFLAYFCQIGPWRMVWIRFGYNPLKDFNARIYQTLDFRIRSKEGTQIKVTPKRVYATKRDIRTLQGIGNSEFSSSKKLDERCYVLRPEYIPPARQMFYQYCDIKIPEIQEMLRKLPKYPSNPRFDSKNGWLPTNFNEQCREIASRHVMLRVRKELAEENKDQQEKQDSRDRETPGTSKEPNPATYCSKMLSNIKRGIYKSVNLAGDDKGTTEEWRPSDSGVKTEPMIIDTVNLTDEEDADPHSEEVIIEVNMDEVVASIPETMEENIDDDNLSQCSDVEIDLETVEEINQLIAKTKKDFGVK